MKTPLPRILRRVKAFSLAETTLALGVLAFCLVSILGMLPTSLNTMRSSMDTALSAQIAQRVMNDVKMTDWDQIVAQRGTSSAGAPYYRLRPAGEGSWRPRYFDDQGNELATTGGNMTAEQRQRRVYNVNVGLQMPVTLPNGTVLADTAAVVVQVSNNPAWRDTTDDNDSTTGWWKETAHARLYQITGIVSRNR